MKDARPIHAVIGVRRRGADTFYVRRSRQMANYPGVWSLLSIQHGPLEMADPLDLDEAADHFRRLSEQRLGSVALHVERFLTSGTSDQNPMGVDVTLGLYEISLAREPDLDPAYYSASRWMSAEAYQSASAGQACGLCLRLWSDYAWLSGITDRPFIPSAAATAERGHDIQAP